MMREGLKIPAVGKVNMKWNDKANSCVFIMTPIDVKHFVNYFDREEKVGPFEFEIPDTLLKVDS